MDSEVTAFYEKSTKEHTLDWRSGGKNTALVNAQELMRKHARDRSETRLLRIALQNLLSRNRESPVRDEIMALLGNRLPTTPLARARLVQILADHPNFNVSHIDNLPGKPHDSGANGIIVDYRSYSERKIADVYTGRGAIASAEWELITSNLQGCICVLARSSSAQLMAHMTPTTHLAYESPYFAATKEKLLRAFEAMGGVSTCTVIANLSHSTKDAVRQAEVEQIARELNAQTILFPGSETAVYVCPESQDIWIIANENCMDGDLGPMFLGFRFGETHIVERRY